MPTNAFTSGITASVDSSGTPLTYDDTLEECFDISGLGQTNDLIEVTHFASAGAKEYIGGLADGSEVSFQCNKVNTASSTQDLVIAMVENKETRSWQVTLTDGTNSETYTFACAMLSWEIAPSLDDKNTITFTGKISGNITRA
jgi:hypothetical protein